MKLYELKEQMKKAPRNIRLLINENLSNDLIIYNDNKPSINYFDLKDIRFEIYENIGENYYYVVNMLQVNKLLQAKKINFKIDFFNEKGNQTKKEFTKLLKDWVKNTTCINEYLKSKDYEYILKPIINYHFDYYYKENSFNEMIKLLDINNYNLYTVFTFELASQINAKFKSFIFEREQQTDQEKIKLNNYKEFIETKLKPRQILNIDLKLINESYFINFMKFYYKIYQYFYYDYETININEVENLINDYHKTIINEPAPINEVKTNEIKNVEITPAPAPVINEINEVKQLAPGKEKIENNEVIEEKESIKLLPAPEQKSEFIQASEIIDYSKILEKFEKLTKNKVCDYCEAQAKFVTYWEGKMKVYLCEKCTIEIYEVNKNEMFV